MNYAYTPGLRTSGGILTGMLELTIATTAIHIGSGTPGALSGDPAFSITRQWTGAGDAHDISCEDTFLRTGYAIASIDVMTRVGQSATGSYDHSTCAQLRARFNGGTLSKYYGVVSSPEIGTGSTVTNILHYLASGYTGGGSATTVYGFYVGDLQGTNQISFASDYYARGRHNGRFCIGTNDYFGIDASAMFQVNSTSASGSGTHALHRGFLPPRVTTSQKNGISSPAAGLVVFDTDLGALCVYSGGWKTVTAA